mmetsp:Transcript_68776/g.163829  ORF Transcript_68776/g.163829 Transcript_68776/m.163829 type:complete len:283 (-) Transcript_68776:224-1072(-)
MLQVPPHLGELVHGSPGLSEVSESAEGRARRFSPSGPRCGRCCGTAVSAQPREEEESQEKCQGSGDQCSGRRGCPCALRNWHHRARRASGGCAGGEFRLPVHAERRAARDTVQRVGSSRGPSCRELRLSRRKLCFAVQSQRGVAHRQSHLWRGRFWERPSLQQRLLDPKAAQTRRGPQLCSDHAHAAARPQLWRWHSSKYDLAEPGFRLKAARFPASARLRRAWPTVSEWQGPDARGHDEGGGRATTGCAKWFCNARLLAPPSLARCGLSQARRLAKMRYSE